VTLLHRGGGTLATRSGWKMILKSMLTARGGYYGERQAGIIFL